MAFKTNDSQQYSLTDSMNNLTSRELKALEKSWAKFLQKISSRQLTKNLFVCFIHPERSAVPILL